MKVKAIGYVRVSSAGQVDRYGLDAQEADVRKHARASGLRLVRISRDEGVSGSVDAAIRPGLADAIAGIRDREAEVLLVPRLDRLARKLTIQEAALAQIWRHGGRVVSADHGEVSKDDPGDPMRTAMRQMMGVFAQLDRSMIVARLRRGREAKKAWGGYAHGRPPYGFRAEGGVLVSEPDEQAVILRVSQLRAEGKSYRETADELTREGRRPRSGGEWHPQTLARIASER